MRFTPELDPPDIKEFEKIQKLAQNEQYREVLDVQSTVAKVEDLKVGDYPAVLFTIDRKFSALEGPRGEYSQVYEINKIGVVLRFISSAGTKEEEQTFDEIFQKIISSITFK